MIWLASIISIWFYYGEISFATALCGCVGKLGSATTDIVTPIVYRGTGTISWPFWLAAFMNCGAFIFIVILNWIDKANEDNRRQLRYAKKK